MENNSGRYFSHYKYSLHFGVIDFTGAEVNLLYYIIIFDLKTLYQKYCCLELNI